MEATVFSTFALALVLGVGCYTLARSLGIPAILFYLSSGILFGPLGLDLLQVKALGEGLLVLVEIAVAIILFEGGLSLSSRSFKAESAAIRRILLLTIPLTGLGAACLAHWVLGLSPKISFVFGALIVVTGPTVIGTLLKSVLLTRRLEILLHWESIWGDVIGVLLSAVALELLGHTAHDTAAGLATDFLLRIIEGIPLGVICGYVLGRFLLPWASRLRDPILPGLLAVAGALGTFSIANTLMESSGPLAATIAGFTLASLRGETLHEIRHFKEQLSSLFIGTLFVLLSAYIDPRPLADIWLRMLFVALFLGAVVRPAATFIALLGTRVPWPERIYVAYIGPRGILAVATAFYASLLVTGRDQEMAILLNTTFAIIFLSGTHATLLCRPLARLLKVMIHDHQVGLLLVGVNPFSSVLAEFLRRYVPVAFVDTRQSACNLAAGWGHETVCADVLNSDVYEEAQDAGFGRLLALTANDALNELVAQRASVHYGQEKVFRILAQPPADEVAVEPYWGGQVAFSNQFFLQEVLRGLADGKGNLQELELDGPAPAGVLPLVLVMDESRGIRILRPAEEVAGKVLCFVSEAGAADPTPGPDPAARAPQR